MADYASLLHWYDEAALVHWTQAGEELPFWEEAHKRIQQEGWSSKVNHPSAAHTTHAIAGTDSRPGDTCFPQARQIYCGRCAGPADGMAGLPFTSRLRR